MSDMVVGTVSVDGKELALGSRGEVRRGDCGAAGGLLGILFLLFSRTLY